MINEIGDYFRGIDYFNDALIVKVALPEQVTVIGNEQLGIKVAKSEDGLWYYYGDKNTVEIEDILDLVKTTVKVYEEAKKKAKLYRAKCEELKAIFADANIEDLETLTFEFAKKKTKKPRKKKQEETETKTEEE